MVISGGDTNIFLGYYLKGAEPPGLFYPEDRSIKITESHNIEYGNRGGRWDFCRGNIICSDPRLVNEPPQQGWTDQTFLDNLNFHPASGSPANGRGIATNGVTTDYFGSARPNPPSIGAVEPNAETEPCSPHLIRWFCSGIEITVKGKENVQTRRSEGYFPGRKRQLGGVRGFVGEDV
jgi:hypothetical protein